MLNDYILAEDMNKSFAQEFNNWTASCDTCDTFEINMVINDALHKIIVD